MLGEFVSPTGPTDKFHTVSDKAIRGFVGLRSTVTRGERERERRKKRADKNHTKSSCSNDRRWLGSSSLRTLGSLDLDNDRLGLVL